MNFRLTKMSVWSWWNVWESTKSIVVVERQLITTDFVIRNLFSLTNSFAEWSTVNQYFCCFFIIMFTITNHHIIGFVDLIVTFLLIASDCLFSGQSSALLCPSILKPNFYLKTLVRHWHFKQMWEIAFIPVFEKGSALLKVFLYGKCECTFSVGTPLPVWHVE